MLQNCNCYVTSLRMRFFRTSASPPFLAGVGLGFVASLSGTYWDAGWHTVRGRDAFLAPPHVLLYAGISLLGGVFALRALGLVSVRRRDWRGTR